MWEFIKHKLFKLGCFLVMALIALAAAALTKVVLGWFHYDEATKEAVGAQVFNYVGKGLLGCVFLLGLVVMARQLIAELRARRGLPPTRLPAQPPPLPIRATPNSRPLPPTPQPGSDRCPHCGLSKYHAIGCPNRGNSARHP
jgi:hypothetical protein